MTGVFTFYKDNLRFFLFWLVQAILAVVYLYFSLPHIINSSKVLSFELANQLSLVTLLLHFVPLFILQLLTVYWLRAYKQLYWFLLVLTSYIYGFSFFAAWAFLLVKKYAQHQSRFLQIILFFLITFAFYFTYRILMTAISHYVFSSILL